MSPVKIAMIITGLKKPDYVLCSKYRIVSFLDKIVQPCLA